MEPFSNQKEFSGSEFKNGSYKRSQICDTFFYGCKFSKCAFCESIFTGCKFQDCQFKNCDLSLSVLKDCVFQNVKFENCQLIGIDWMNTNLNKMKFQLSKPVEFDRCVLNHNTFLGLNLKNIIMTRCTAHDVSFEEADLSGADCRGSDFSNSRFLNTNLTEADFSGASHYVISAGLNTLKKTKFSLPEAMNLLNGLDIILTDHDELSE